MSIGDYGQDIVQSTARVEQTVGTEKPIDKLVPESDLHREVLDYLVRRIDYSERSMSGFYSRWNTNEKKLQAYISLPDYEQQLKLMTARGEAPAVTSIVVPYSYATVWTIVTYLIHAFCGKKPMFDVSSYKEESMESAPYMETMLQFNADHTKLILCLIQWFLDAESYGVGAMRCLWNEEKAKRSIWTSESPGGQIMPGLTPTAMRKSQFRTIYQGNAVVNIDPYMFFPDPRVPMAQANRRAEFIFWRSFEGLHTLQKAEAIGQLKWVDKLKGLPKNVGNSTAPGAAQRTLLSKGTDSPGDSRMRDDNRTVPFHQVDQGTIEIIPSKLGLGTGDTPEKWLFSIGNKSQIIQAEPLDYDHDRHPIVVIEPSSFGYSFGQPATVDFLGPIQDTLSWFVNSHIHNVRVALNNMFVVDPSMVEMQDLKNPGPGKIIRLKRSAYGQDVRTILNQLQVQDVTSNHMQSMQLFLRMGDTLAAVNDNLRGIQQAGGRKTATETRTAAEAGASRLAARARYVSAQGMVDLGEQMSVNLQQLLDMEFYLQVVGAKGQAHPLNIGPQQIAGDFHFPVHDGTLPIDRTALMNVWKEIWMTVATNEALAQQYDGGRLFEYIAELGGAKNISQFKISLAPDDGAAAAAAAGNAVPLGTNLPGGGGRNLAPVRRPLGNSGVPRGNAGAPTT